MNRTARDLRSLTPLQRALLAFAMVGGCTASTTIGTSDGGLDAVNPGSTGGVGTNTGGFATTGGVGQPTTGGFGATGGAWANTGGSRATGGAGATGGYFVTGGSRPTGDGGAWPTGGVPATGGIWGTSTGGAFGDCSTRSDPDGTCAPASSLLTPGQGAGGFGGSGPSYDVVLPTCGNPTSFVHPASSAEFRVLLSRTWTLCEGTKPALCQPQSGLVISSNDRFAFRALAKGMAPLATPNATGELSYCYASGTVVFTTDAGQVLNTEAILGYAGNGLVLVLNSGENETRYVSN